MAITVDYSIFPWLITIPKTDLALVSGTKYNLTVDTFWELLRDYADSPESMPNPIIYTRIPATASTPSITEVNIDYYLLQFEDGLYSVNIINGNTNIRDVEVKNQVSVNTNNTTGFIDPVFLEQSLFAGEVVIDIINGVAGTGTTPAGEIIGTRQTPSGNIINALEIATYRGIHVFRIINSMTISNIDLSNGQAFVGESPFITLTVEPSADVTSCTMSNLTVAGELDGLNVLRDCSIGAVTNVSGFIEKCAFSSQISINGPTFIFESYSQIVGSGYPKFDVGAHDVTFRNYRGSAGLINSQVGHNSSCGIYGGRLVIENTCVGGEIHARGDPFELVDDSGIGCTVIRETTLDNKNALTFPKYIGLK